jgi:hypothetical protein
MACPGWQLLEELSTEEVPCKVMCADLVTDARNELIRLSTTVDENEIRGALEAVTCYCEEEDSV